MQAINVLLYEPSHMITSDCYLYLQTCVYNAKARMGAQGNAFLRFSKYFTMIQTRAFIKRGIKTVEALLKYFICCTFQTIKIHEYPRCYLSQIRFLDRS